MGSARTIMMLLLPVALLWGMRYAAGRLSPKVGIGTLFFLLSRKPVLWLTIVGTGACLAVLLPGAMAKGKDGLGDMLLLAGISFMCGGGFAAIIVAPIWAIMRASGPTPVFELEDGESLLHESAANHFLAGESRGGKVLLTDRRLGFRPHRFNVQLDTWSVPREAITRLEREGAYFLLVFVTLPGSEEHSEEHWLVSQRADELRALVQPPT
jgi:hypothetical protein